MKKLLSLSLALALSTAVFAQDNTGSAGLNYSKLRFGAYVAPTMSWMRPTSTKDDAKEYNVESKGSRVGFIYGLMAEYFFAENYGIVTGIQVNSTGGKILSTRATQLDSIPNTVNSADFEYRLQYLEIPLNLKLRTDEVSKFRFFGQAGLTLGINIAKKADYTVNYINSSGVRATATGEREKIISSGTLKSTVAPIMLQMNIGVGAEYPLTDKLSAYLGLFFNNGFLPDATNPDNIDSENLGYTGSFHDANTRLNNFALRLGLLF